MWNFNWYRSRSTENVLRFLFCCSNHYDAAEDAAVIYSLMGCCKAAGVDFKKWTLHSLNHIYEYGNDYHKRFCPITTS